MRGLVTKMVMSEKDIHLGTKVSTKVQGGGFLRIVSEVGN